MIVNFTRDPRRRMTVNFDIDPASDLDCAQSAMIASVQPMEAILAQPPVTTIIDSVNETRA